MNDEQKIPSTDEMADDSAWVGQLCDAWTLPENNAESFEQRLHARLQQADAEEAARFRQLSELLPQLPEVGSPAPEPPEPNDTALLLGELRTLRDSINDLRAEVAWLRAETAALRRERERNAYYTSQSPQILTPHLRPEDRARRIY